ncbi:MAG: acyltransferase [Eubacteriales bacterium]|nr:acyltransferase [Eubacteriales bacterium]
MQTGPMITRQTTERLVAVDILRVISAFFVFVFHSRLHIGCDYGVLNTFVSLCPIFMTFFFMLSGFSLSLTNHTRHDFSTVDEITAFYRKRALSILPTYWFIALVYPFFDVLVCGGTWAHNLTPLPIDLLGVQSVLHSIFGYGHNGGTWFVSCLLFSYAAFPLLFKLIEAMSLRKRIAVGSVAMALSCYAPVAAQVLQIEGLYSNIFFRMLEFVIGMLLCSLWFDIREREWYRKRIAKWSVMWIALLLLVPALTYAAKGSMRLFDTQIVYQIYNFFTIPCFSLMLLSAAGLRSKRLQSSRVFAYSVKASYVFFFAQFFTWETIRALLPILGRDGNLIRIVGSFAICILYTVLLHECVEKPLGRLLRKRTESRLRDAAARL